MSPPCSPQRATGGPGTPAERDGTGSSRPSRPGNGRFRLYSSVTTRTRLPAGDRRRARQCRQSRLSRRRRRHDDSAAATAPTSQSCPVLPTQALRVPAAAISSPASHIALPALPGVGVNPYGVRSSPSRGVITVLRGSAVICPDRDPTPGHLPPVVPAAAIIAAQFLSPDFRASSLTSCLLRPARCRAAFSLPVLPASCPAWRSRWSWQPEAPASSSRSGGPDRGSAS